MSCVPLSRRADESRPMTPSHYNDPMARGWESKAVDDQVAAAEAAQADRRQHEVTAAARERASRRDTVQLKRARTLQSLQTACDGHYRAQLEHTLADLDAELAALGEASG